MSTINLKYLERVFIFAMTEQKKYILVHSKQDANEWEQKNYRVHTFTVAPVENGMIQEYYLMSLKEESKYDDVEAFRSVPITPNWQQVPEGIRIIHHTSKEVIQVMVSDKPSKLDTQRIKQELDEAFNVVENWDIKDDNLHNEILGHL